VVPSFFYGYSWIGAMMVASIHMTKKEGEEVKRGDEVS
jgi:phosphatidylserine decarboxylase